MTAPVPERFVQLGVDGLLLGEPDANDVESLSKTVLAPVLADLRAQVQALRDESIARRRATMYPDGHDSIPSAWHNGGTSMADAVLALLDGGGS